MLIDFFKSNLTQFISIILSHENPINIVAKLIGLF
jgi:hypothetical protein